MTDTTLPGRRFEGVHCTLEVSRPRDRVVVVTITGTDVGELGDVPFKELEPDLADARPLELFIDTRDTRGASIGVSQDWAMWLQRNRERFVRVTMLPGSRYIQVTADFVRRFADLGDCMYITTDTRAFDSALAAAVQGDSAR
jgi:hypothetical protein